MPFRINLKSIPGYENMTPEQKIRALEEYEIPDPDYSGYVKKDLYDKTASESAERKRKLDAYLTEEERKKQEAAEEKLKLEGALADANKKLMVVEHKAKFLALGYSNELAQTTAQAMVDGDTEKVFAGQKAFMEEHDKNLRADLLKGTPTPPAGSGGEGDSDYFKLAREAQEAGETGKAAYYTRLAQSENKS